MGSIRSSLSLRRLALRAALLLPAVLTHAWSPPENLGRRGALGRLASIAAGILTGGGRKDARPSNAADHSPPSLSSSFSSPTSSSSPSSPTSSPFDAYYITPVENYVRSKLDKIDSKEFLNQLATHEAGSVWLGEHHNSLSDHNFQATVIREVHRKRQRHRHLRDTPMAVGLEQVQSQFQPVLDAYASGAISLDEMRSLVQWDRRWSWPFEKYREIFEVARDLGIRLLAMNVDSEDLVVVEREGYPGLSAKRLHKYIKDPIGFAEFATTSEFQTYNDFVIKPSYDLHRRLGLLRRTALGDPMESEMTFGRFLSGRILWDEGMASSAFSWCAEHPDGLLIGLVGADHVKYENGVPGRFARMVGNRKLLPQFENAATTKTRCTAVIINPTLIDGRPSGTVSRIPTSDSPEYPERVTLQLRYAKAAPGETSLPDGSSGADGVLSFSDYVVVT